MSLVVINFLYTEIGNLTYMILWNIMLNQDLSPNVYEINREVW